MKWVKNKKFSLRIIFVFFERLLYKAFPNRALRRQLFKRTNMSTLQINLEFVKMQFQNLANFMYSFPDWRSNIEYSMKINRENPISNMKNFSLPFFRLEYRQYTLQMDPEGFPRKIFKHE